MFEKDYKMVINSVKRRNITVDSLILTTSFPFNGYYLAYVFKCPVILFSNIGLGIHMTRWVGNPENPSYQNDISMPFVAPFTFLQRLINTVGYYLINSYHPERLPLQQLMEK